MIVNLLYGALGAGYAVAGLFFLKFWATTRDRLFSMFAAAFGLLAVQRVILAVTQTVVEDQALFYLIRLAAFLLIIIAIVDKNRR